ncbi:MAG: hypothetical protein ABR501_02250 [Pyrinomonadaceae bacterium]
MRLHQPLPAYPGTIMALTAVFLLLATGATAQGVPLRIVNVGAPAINCVFNPACTNVVNDTTDNVTLSTGGTGFFQSRTFNGKPGSPAAGLFAYEYRLDLRNAVGRTAIACVDWVSLDFGPVVSTLDYNGDRRRGDQVFVITSGGMGTIGIRSAIKLGNKITFRFTSPVCGGGSPGAGKTTFFWGLVAKTGPHFVTAKVHETGGTVHIIQARAPII